jgi:hypothetical protein
VCRPQGATGESLKSVDIQLAEERFVLGLVEVHWHDRLCESNCIMDLECLATRYPGEDFLIVLVNRGIQHCVKSAGKG